MMFNCEYNHNYTIFPKFIHLLCSVSFVIHFLTDFLLTVFRRLFIRPDAPKETMESWHKTGPVDPGSLWIRPGHHGPPTSRNNSLFKGLLAIIVPQEGLMKNLNLPSVCKIFVIFSQEKPADFGRKIQI